MKVKRSQIYITDILLVMVYYIILANLWVSDLFNLTFNTLKNTDWAWIIPVLSIVIWLAPIIWLIVKATIIRAYYE